MGTVKLVSRRSGVDLRDVCLSKRGVAWADQKLGCTVAEFVDLLRQERKHQIVKFGDFSFTRLDHNSKDYAWVSNKQVTIVGHILLRSNHDPDRVFEWKECVKAVTDAFL